MITSAGPARALGLARKGHLGVGADARRGHLPRVPAASSMFASPRYVIKGGEVVVEEGEMRGGGRGQGVRRAPGLRRRGRGVPAPDFQQLYTMSFENYRSRWSASTAWSCAACRARA